ncbi:MAG: hypothetical protein OXN89_15115 [Bryobacterales bacterium]|nr:hypothetical protein [Bryobacterales bacterium]
MVFSETLFPRRFVGTQHQPTRRLFRYRRMSYKNESVGLWQAVWVEQPSTTGRRVVAHIARRLGVVVRGSSSPEHNDQLIEQAVDCHEGPPKLWMWSRNGARGTTRRSADRGA